MSAITVLYILGYGAAILSLLPLSIGLARRKYMNPIYKAALLIAVLTFTCDLSAAILALNGIRNWFMIPLGNMLYALPVFWFYHHLIQPKHHKLWLGLALAFIIIQIIEVFFFTGLSAYTSVSSTYLSITFTVSSIILLKGVVRKTSTVNRKGSSVFISMLKQPLFWLIISILIYYGGSLPNALYGHYLSTKQTGVFYFTTGISSGLLILYRLIFARGLYQIPQVQHQLNPLSVSKH